MIESLLTEQQERLRDKVRALVKGVPRLLLLEMDADRVQYPREFVEEAARRGLLGLRFPREYGGGGLSWTDEIVAIEEVGVLGTALSWENLTITSHNSKPPALAARWLLGYCQMNQSLL